MPAANSSAPLVGIVGAGQLARMTAPAAAALGVRLRVLAATPEDCAAAVVTDVVLGSPDDGEPVTLEATPFELLRTFGGRRSIDQIRALPWSADPAPFLPLFGMGPLEPPARPVIE